jgi:putative transposase
VIAKHLRISDRSVERRRQPGLGPAEHGQEDQRWTVARIRAVIVWKFHVNGSMAAV